MFVPRGCLFPWARRNQFANLGRVEADLKGMTAGWMDRWIEGGRGITGWDRSMAERIGNRKLPQRSLCFGQEASSGSRWRKERRMSGESSTVSFLYLKSHSNEPLATTHLTLWQQVTHQHQDFARHQLFTSGLTVNKNIALHWQSTYFFSLRLWWGFFCHLHRLPHVNKCTWTAIQNFQ